MPKAALPTTPRGWLVAIAASMVGLIASFLFLGLAERLLG